MAGPTTAERGERQQLDSGPPRPPRIGWPPLSRTRVIVILVGLTLLAGGTLWTLYGSQWLRVERVTVSGTDVLTPAQVREAADVPIGSPLISIDTDAIADRLRRKLPRIDSIDVTRSWPDGIDLKVTERKPVLVVEKGGEFVEVDDEGVRFATVRTAPKGVPTLEITRGPAASLRRFGTERLAREAVRVVAVAPAAVGRDLRTVKVRSYDSISLELSGGRTVDWGSSEKSRAKAATLKALMKASPGARHFDVSVPTAPASSGS
ncbi:cell division protein FtsQ/DivIB [Streptomyces cavernae]|uniref:cell division protein FtsQ/DivIB n=1 Tax=Streptomyces cavernae TaxID=2259034 RepID=UPI000FEC10FF|nr:FtsQ-type POTRA domain-containing protein [Streptomyces cavernae]